MNYAVFEAGSSELLCMGSAEICAAILGATLEQFERWAKYPQAAYKYGYSIQPIESSNPLQCPCDTCKKAPPKPKGAVCASCDDVHCTKQENWMKRYWKQLNKRFYQKK